MKYGFTGYYQYDILTGKYTAWILCNGVQVDRIETKARTVLERYKKDNSHVIFKNVGTIRSAY